MYSIDDEDRSLVDSDLALIPDREDVIVVQDADLDHSTAEKIAERIEKASEDMKDVVETHDVVMESIASGDRTKMVVAIEKARRLRKRLSATYPGGPNRLMAVESVRTANVSVFALEEEAEEEVGWLRRIFRAIANMFKALWRFLTGNWKKSEDLAEKQQEKADDNKSKTEAVKDVAAPSNLSVEVPGRYRPVVAWLKANKSTEVEKMIEDFFRNYADMEDLLNGVLGFHRMMKEFFNMLSGTSMPADKRDEAVAKLYSLLEVPALRLPKITAKVTIGHVPEDSEVLSVNGFESLPSGAGWCAVKIAKKADRNNYRLRFEKIPVDFSGVDNKLPVPSAIKLAAFHELTVRIIEANKRYREKCTEMGVVIQDTAKHLEDLANKPEQGTDKNAVKDAQHFLQHVGKLVTNIDKYATAGDMLVDFLNEWVEVSVKELTKTQTGNDTTVPGAREASV